MTAGEKALGDPDGDESPESVTEMLAQRVVRHQLAPQRRTVPPDSSDDPDPAR